MYSALAPAWTAMPWVWCSTLMRSSGAMQVLVMAPAPLPLAIRFALSQGSDSSATGLAFAGADATGVVAAGAADAISILCRENIVSTSTLRRMLAKLFEERRENTEYSCLGDGVVSTGSGSDNGNRCEGGSSAHACFG